VGGGTGAPEQLTGKTLTFAQRENIVRNSDNGCGTSAKKEKQIKKDKKKKKRRQ
jgi:hypothetical protein